MDPSYYETKALEEQKKAAKFLTKRGELEKKAANHDAAAAKDEAAALRASSDSTRRSKLGSAENARKRAAEARKQAGDATIAAAKAQATAAKHAEDASKQRARDADAADRKRRSTEAEVRRKSDAANRDAVRAQQRRDAAAQRITSNVAMLGSQTASLDARTADLERAIAESRASAPRVITVLMIAGTPEGGQEPLRLDREVRQIDLKLQASRYRDQIKLQSIQATRVGDIIDALNRFEPDIVHFSGHGSSDALLFEAPNGHPHALSGENLALLLQVAPRPIRLVVFNACESAADGGHVILPTGGHRKSPLAVVGSPQWRPSVLPTVLS